MLLKEAVFLDHPEVLRIRFPDVVLDEYLSSGPTVAALSARVILRFSSMDMVMEWRIVNSVWDDVWIERRGATITSGPSFTNLEARTHLCTVP